MAKSLSFVTSVLVAAALAVPTVSAAQGRSRGGDDGGGGRSGSGSGEVAVPRSAPAPAPAPPPAPRTSEPSSSQPTSSNGGDSNRGPTGPATARSRGNEPVRGYAQPRTNVPRGGGSTYVTVWPSWYYGGYYGYSGYPYGYFGGRGYWNRYGLYDPFLFDPYGYYGGFYGSPYFWGPEVGYGYGEREPRARGEATGSIRLKVNPKTAKVYVDGALAGVADDFDGLGGHLQVSPGPHQLELRADGFETFTGQVNVKEDRTQTERINLRKR
jgi:hypothetical protein